MRTLTIIVVLSLAVGCACAQPGGHGRSSRRDGHTPVTLGEVLITVAGVYLLSRVAPSTPPPGGYGPPAGCGGPGYAGGRYDVPCVVERQGQKIVVNRAYQPGTQLLVLGDWVTDPNTHAPLYRREIGLLVVQTTNGRTSLCSVVRGWAGRGDDIVIAPTPAPPPAWYH
ncbi:hypothetical protein COT12_03275 [Candidatus Berkelbacteria bacterium CG08_land_8_20_14_0_20_39_8]|uniref:Uncharacterized protein n=1 Tax=Candidatus Berkelbacteria bacterium CG08_land_8_20_14_0_20_39_8 TaxID=1974511 RepID=A0A2M6YBE0_9BACT|nr:MAG: hypothetical protein COT12_03275 [Candidatus Berkelbacteria bacterium CG08_land_8_20_14_0_20_39_8]